MIQNHTYPYITVLAEENIDAIQAFLRRVELLAGSMALLTAPQCAGSNAHQPNGNSRLETLLRNYWVLSDTLSVRLPWIESSLIQSADGPCGQFALIHKMSTLWNLSSGHLALDCHFEIMDLRHRCFENLGQANLAFESSETGAEPRVAWMETYDQEVRPTDIWNASNHLPLQPEPPSRLIDAARSVFAEMKKEKCHEWREPLHCIRRCLIAAAVKAPSHYGYLIDYAINLTEEECDKGDLILVPEGIETLTY